MQTALRNTLNAFHLACLVDWIQSNSSEESKCRTQGYKALRPFTELSPKNYRENLCILKGAVRKAAGRLHLFHVSLCTWMDAHQNIFYTSRLQIPTFKKSLLDSENFVFQSASMFGISGYLPEESDFTGAALPSLATCRAQLWAQRCSWVPSRAQPSSLQCIILLRACAAPPSSCPGGFTMNSCRISGLHFESCTNWHLESWWPFSFLN